MPLIVLTTIVPIAKNRIADKKLKKEPTCPKCKNELDVRVRRGIFVKTLLFWLPIKRYSCYYCQRKIYILN